ncbi:MAG TPA: histidinol phosphate phosphatase, partial [Novosphingobium sp.]|nr:histidinol phosphate phosphatase [Novosphingobium sp.]
MRLESDIALACRLADAAAQALLPHFRSGIAAERKADASPVSLAD